MKKIISYFILLIIIILISLITTLATIGIETDKFNDLISDKVTETKNINLKLNKIKFKIDLKKFSLFLETQDPKIIYRDLSVPAQNVKVYVDFFSLIETDIKIKKISLTLKELDIAQLNKLSVIFKPSNFKSLLNNKIKEGKLVSEIDVFLDDKGILKNFIARGSVKDLKAELTKYMNLTKVNLNFFADKNDILIKNIFGDIENIKILDGDLKLNLENGVKINSNFNSRIDLNEKQIEKFSKIFRKSNLTKSIKNLKADLNNNISVDLDETYKIKNYNYSINGNVEKSKFELTKPIKNNLITKKIDVMYLSDLQIKTILSPKNINLKGNGKYSIDGNDFLKINLENNLKNESMNLKLDFDYKNNLELKIINYNKPENSVANISLDLNKNKNKIKINTFSLKDGSNSIKIFGLEFNKNKFSTFKKIEVKTTNNNFFIQNGDTILVKGNRFDATNLAKFLSNQRDENKFEKLSGNIEIAFENIKVPMSEKLENFKLIGQIKKGQFVKISSKGDFGGNNFLDISMKKDENSDKKYLEIYSDLTRPLLTEYSFFKGLSGGKLLFTSIIDGAKSNSKLKIENFKVVNAPGVIKLLSLADLRGLADLAEGEGLSFDLLEIDMEKDDNFLKLNEILALGPSISVLMEGYQEKNGLISLRGTLVPAKTLNKMISKIPVLGNIVIPKEVGEGLFGISFKMKGPKGNVKTSINPIRTITPRFIQKIIDRNKETK